MNIKKILIAVTILFSLPAAANNGFTIYGQLEKGRNDTLRFSAWPYLISTPKELQLPHTSQTVILKDGRFSIHLDGMGSVFYFNFDLHKKSPLPTIRTYYIAESKDSIEVYFTDGDYRFAGEGAVRYQYQYEAANRFSQLSKKYAAYGVTDSLHYEDLVRRTVARRMHILYDQLQDLDNWRKKLPDDLFITFRNNIIGWNGEVLYTDYSKWLNFYAEKCFTTEAGIETGKQVISSIFDSALKDTLFTRRMPHSSVLATNYLHFLSLRDVFRNPPLTQDQRAEIIASLPPNAWRDEEQTEYIAREYEKFNDAENIIRRVLDNIKNPYCHDLLNSIVGRMSGKPAEDFVLTDTRDKKIKMSSFLNKVVVVDFWFTGCSGCTLFYDQTLKSLEERFADSSRCAFVSVCIDEDPVTWKKSIRENIYTSEKAINLKTSGKMHEDRILKYYNVLGYPTAIVIDKQGRTRAITSEHYNSEKLAQLLEKLVAE